MKIVFQHTNILPVLKYGGTERILYWHMLELIKQGHEVVLIGHPDCKLEKTQIEHIPFSDKNNWLHLIPKNADILHLQYNYFPNIHIPVINTLHGNGQPGENFSKNTVFVGKKHAENHNASAYIHNAIDLSEYPYTPRKLKNRYDEFLFLAKASWSVKNIKDCIRACKKSKKHLNIAGGKKFTLSSYIHNHGSVNNEEKLKLFSKSDALLFPVKWQEPFGIAMIEAMSQGLPVIGSQYGSLKEIITKDVGIICKDYQEFLQAIKSESHNFNPDIIRKYVEEQFSIEKYTRSYLLYYQDVIDSKELNPQIPSWKNDFLPGTLLSF